MSLVLVLFVELLIFSSRVAVISAAAAGLMWLASRLFFEKK